MLKKIGRVRRVICLVATLLLLPPLLPLFAVANTQTSVAFGSYVEITIADSLPPAVRQQLFSRVMQRFADMEKRFYAWDKNSELAAINKQVQQQQFPIMLSPPMLNLWQIATRYSVQTQQHFNPAIGQLVDLWGFYKQPPANRPPPPAAIKKWLLHPVALPNVRIHNQQITAAHPNIKVDFGAIIKGHAADTARHILEQAGIKNALINVGGSLVAMGQNQHRPWRVALRHKQGEPPLGVIDLHDGEAVSTSGGGEIYFEHQGHRYHHLLDPATGYPARQVQTAVVVARGQRAGAVSDAVATALVIANPAITDIILSQFSNLLIWQIGEQARLSPALAKRLKNR